VAIDINEAEYWGEEDEYVFYKRGKAKNGHYLRYATISLVDTGTKCTIAALPLKKGDDNLCIVDELLCQAQRLVKVDYVLLDRGFYDHRIMRLIDEKGSTYIIPFRRTLAIKKLMMDREKCHLLYTLNRVHRYRYTTHLYLKRDDSTDGYAGVVSNKHVKEDMIDWILEYYMKRWNIENSYKEIKHYRVKTSSPKKQYRLLLYAIAHLLVNIIQLLRTMNNTFLRYYELKKMMPILLGETTDTARISRTLTIHF
jgi:IS4 transposase